MNGVEPERMQPAVPEARPREREHRLRLLVKIQIVSDAGKTTEGFVRNLSSFGICVRSATIPSRGQKITVRKQGFGEVQATVRWSNDTEFGAEFVERIDVEQFNFEARNKAGHFMQKNENGHVWTGFHHEVSTRRPGLKSP